MASRRKLPLLTDPDGYRYFIAELNAFKIFGPSFDELRQQIDPMMNTWFLSPDRLPELREGADGMRRIVKEVSPEAQQIMADIMRYVDSHDEPADEELDDEDGSGEAYPRTGLVEEASRHLAGSRIGSNVAGSVTTKNPQTSQPVERFRSWLECPQTMPHRSCAEVDQPYSGRRAWLAKSLGSKPRSLPSSPSRRRERAPRPYFSKNLSFSGWPATR
jgi:hypothetical protein